MPLNWNLARINDNDRLCWIKSRKKADQRTMNPVTHFLIWATIPVGINEITLKNVDEFIHRLEILKLLDAAEYNASLGRDTSRDYPTPEQVRAHIGLNTNASNVPMKKWLAKRGEELAHIAKNRVLYPVK